MLNKNKRSHACLDFLNNQRGFTLLSMLLTLAILFITVPFLEYVTKSLNNPSNYTDLSFYQFFHFMRDDILRSNEFIIENQALSLDATDDTTVTYQKYENLIRRQVDGAGHEVFLRNVSDMSFEKISYGVKVTITTLNGAVYEKKFNFYP
ncbi:competence type IV pilus minor pilin ComGF [Virgibacillus flavescens]|uniref:competence type IV pilus minor pilin ComGF n=1 Tax=Virgibacillus flavescens TaxID=1611422 RepID=UPI003D357641